MFLARKVVSYAQPYLMPVVEQNVVPDAIVRYGIRLQLAERLSDISRGTIEEQAERKEKMVKELKKMPIAIQTGAANEQHYEVNTDFYKLVLGPRLKYSCGYWPNPDTSFEESEVAMLELYCTRAELKDGMRIVDLGCGWGSLTLFLAEKYPNSTITSISNSSSQKKYVDEQCVVKGFKNVEVITGDISIFDLPVEKRGTYDRVCSIEMFEHMKNYQLLMRKVAGFLRPGGKLFLHIFTHREHPYHFETGDGWMAQNFFTGGIMGSDDLILRFQDDLKIQSHWRVNGTHYSRTSEAWLRQMDGHKSELLPILANIYGTGNETKWFVYWRLFFIACAELWGYENGEQWIVSHYLFKKPE